MTVETWLRNSPPYAFVWSFGFPGVGWYDLKHAHPNRALLMRVLVGGLEVEYGPKNVGKWGPEPTGRLLLLSRNGCDPGAGCLPGEEGFERHGVLVTKRERAPRDARAFYIKDPHAHEAAVERLRARSKDPHAHAADRNRALLVGNYCSVPAWAVLWERWPAQVGETLADPRARKRYAAMRAELLGEYATMVAGDTTGGAVLVGRRWDRGNEGGPLLFIASTRFLGSEADSQVPVRGAQSVRKILQNFYACEWVMQGPQTFRFNEPQFLGSSRRSRPSELRQVRAGDFTAISWDPAVQNKVPPDTLAWQSAVGFFATEVFRRAAFGFKPATSATSAATIAAGILRATASEVEPTLDAASVAPETSWEALVHLLLAPGKAPPEFIESWPAIRDSMAEQVVAVSRIYLRRLERRDNPLVPVAQTVVAANMLWNAVRGTHKAFANRRSNPSDDALRAEAQINMSPEELRAWALDPRASRASTVTGLRSLAVLADWSNGGAWTDEVEDVLKRAKGFNARHLAARNLFGRPVVDGMSRREIALRNWGHDVRKPDSPAHDAWLRWSPTGEADAARRRLTPEMVAEILAKHEEWREDLKIPLLRQRSGRPAHFVAVDLRGWDFRGANLQSVTFRNADLTGADFRGANLREVDFRHAILRGADLRGADLLGARVREADLAGARIDGEGRKQLGTT